MNPTAFEILIKMIPHVVQIVLAGSFFWAMISVSKALNIMSNYIDNVSERLTIVHLQILEIKRNMIDKDKKDVTTKNS